MRNNRRKRKLRICRILSIGCFIASIIIFSNCIYKANQQKVYEAMLKTTVAQTELTEEQAKNMTTQNISIPEDVLQQIEEKQAIKRAEEARKAEEERIAREKAEEEKRKQEEQNKQVTSRGNAQRTEKVTGTKAEYQAYAKQKCVEYAPV